MAVWRPPLLALLTNAGSSNAAGLTWNVSDVYKPNEQVVDVLTCRRFLADSSGGVDVQINEGMPQVKWFEYFNRWMDLIQTIPADIITFGSVGCKGQVVPRCCNGDKVE